MENDFCKALAENDTATLKTVIKKYLSTLDADSDQAGNLEKIKQWLETHDCVEAAAIESQVLASEPPIQRFMVMLKTPSGSPVMKSIGIKLYPHKFTSDLK